MIEDPTFSLSKVFEISALHFPPYLFLDYIDNNLSEEKLIITNISFGPKDNHLYLIHILLDLIFDKNVYILFML